ncbi:MAG: asparagine synthase (glutamine-hydrolyzing) [Gammaproteobacteria bacterium]|nr:asparagine synthase (glutamine-hydrolyzing) [Gammaproteobacteria bacterium]
MCGINGLLDFRGQSTQTTLEHQAETMAAAMEHRGPDSAGVWADAECGIALGHRRLAIIDLSANGHQPMHSTCERYVISYNGEVYNFAELRDELAGAGHAFRGGSDTEVILAAIAEWGLAAAVGRFVGMFAIALWDRQDQRLSLVRDRVGIKPIYYGRAGDVFLFGSEMDALATHPDFTRDINRDAVALYLARNYVPSPMSIYQGMHKLPPGTILHVSANDQQPRLEPFWSLQDIANSGIATPFSGTETEAVDELEKILLLAVKQRMVADVPLGVFLSGGIDSSVVTALMQAQHDRPVKSYAIGYHEADYNEAPYAEAVAQHLGTDHTTFMVSANDAMDVIPMLGSMFDEPFADSSQIPTYIVCKLARQETTVVLSGDGGDEVFGGYTRHLWSEKIARLSARLPGWSKGAIAGSITRLNPAQWDQILRFLPRSLQQSKPGSKLHRIAGLLDAQDAGEVYQRLMNHWQEPHTLVRGSEPQSTIFDQQQYWPTGADATSLLMYLDGMTYLPDNCLSKTDRASMAVSLEARVPLLDHRVIDFAWQLPLEYKINGGVGKQALRKVLYKHVPQNLFERPKMGFGVPVRDWLRGPLRDWADDLLNADRLRQQGYLNPEPIQEKWQQHRSGKRDWYNQIWSVLMFQAWLDARNL